MATRVFSWIRKSSLVNALSQASFSSRSFSTFKLGQSSSTPRFWATPRSVAPPANSAFRSGIAHPHYGSSLGVNQVSQSLRYSSTSGVYTNINRFGKQRRNRGEMKGGMGNHICFGKYALQVLEPAWISSRQISAGLLAIKRNMRGGKSIVRIFPHKPVSLKPAETRMGRGKGSTAYWVAGVTPGRILYEINGVPETIARRAISVAASKMPIRTQFVRS